MRAEIEDRTHELCGVLSGLSFSDIPQGTIERAKDLLVDHIGVAVHSADLPWTRIVQGYVAAAGGPPESTVYGLKQKVGRGFAALANGTAGHGIGLDDTHNASYSHPGSVIFPAALAVAEATGAAPHEFLAAVVAGYEAQCRAGVAANGAHARGFHLTAASGVFGAAAAAARLLKLGHREFESALGIALSAASGVKQFAHDAEGDMVKRVHAGMPAQSGIQAAQLAAAGLTGPRGAIDGACGFMRQFAGGGDADVLTRDLGQRWVIDDMSIKLYACCLFFHSAIDALRDCRKELGFAPDEIESVLVSVPRKAMHNHVEYRPKSVMAAQYSLPYAVAAAIALDPENPQSFGLQAIAGSRMGGLMDKVRIEHAPDLEQYLPQRYAARVRVTLNNGRAAQHLRLDASGSAECPVDRDGIVTKFRALTAGTRSNVWQDDVIEHVHALGRGPSLERLMQLLREPQAGT